MTNTYTTNLALILQETGTNNNTWNDYLTDNAEFLDALAGNITTVNTTGGTTTLTATQQRVNVVKVTGVLASNAIIVFAGTGGKWIIQNDTTGSFTLTVKVTGQSGATVDQGTREFVYFNGTDIARVTVEVASVVQGKTGTYTGDGSTSKAITGVGFQPKYVRITERSTVHNTEVAAYESTDYIIDDNASGGAVALDGNDRYRFKANAIIAFGADGFTVDDGGSDQHPNQNGTVYNYLCLGW